MSFLFGQPSLPKVEPLPPVPTADDPAIEEARRKELAAEQARSGAQSTILTSGLGDAAPAPVAYQTILGG